MKRIAMLALAVSATGAFEAAARADGATKIGYVDLQRALEETAEGKSAKAKLKADFERKQNDLNAKQEDLKKRKTDIDNQAALMQPAVLAQKQQELAKGVGELQETYMRLQKDLQQKEAEATQKIFGKMQEIIKDIASENHLDYVLEKNSGILFGPPSMDFTTDLIHKFDALKGKSSDAGSSGGDAAARKPAAKPPIKTK